MVARLTHDEQHVAHEQHEAQEALPTQDGAREAHNGQQQHRHNHEREVLTQRDALHGDAADECHHAQYGAYVRNVAPHHVAHCDAGDVLQG